MSARQELQQRTCSAAMCMSSSLRSFAAINQAPAATSKQGPCWHAEFLLTLMAAKPWPGALAAASMLFMKMRMWASQSASLP